MNFDEGMQVIYGPNEYGKSTIMEFIKIMFYGKMAGEKVAVKNRSLRGKYLPWSGNQMGGKIIFEYDGNEYEIQKKLDSSSPSKDEVMFQNISTGEKISLGKGQEIGEYLFGIDVRSFERSSFIGNIGKSDFELYKKEEDKTAEKIIANFSENSNFTASKRLIEAINDLESPSKRSGKILKLKCEIDELKIKIHSLKEKERHQQQIHEDIEKLEKLKSERLEIQRYLSDIKKIKYLSDLEILISEVKNYENLKTKIGKIQLQKPSYESYIKDLKLKSREIENLYQQLKAFDFSDPGSKDIRISQKEYEQVKFLVSQEYETEKLLNELNYFKFPECKKNYDSNIFKDLNNLSDNYKNLQIGIQSKKAKNITLISAFLNVIFLLISLFIFMKDGVNSLAFYVSSSFGVFMMVMNAIIYAKNRKKFKLLEKLNSEANNLVNSEKKIQEENLQKYRMKIEEILNKYKISSVNEFYMSYVQMQSNGRIDETCGIIKGKIKTLVNDLMDEVSKIKSVNSYQQCKDVIECIYKLVKDISNFEERIKIKSNILNISDHSLKNLELIKNQIEGDINYTYADKQRIVEQSERLEYLNSLDLEEKILDLQKNVKVFDCDSNELEKKLKDEEKTLDSMMDYLESLRIAYDSLEEVSNNLRKNFNPRLNQRASEIFCNITQNKYEDIRVQKDYTILINNNGFYISHDKFSNGTIDQAYFALRIAISELIFQNNRNIPLLLDDVFMQYDDMRLESLLKFLQKYSKSSKRQIILFTCHHRITEFISGENNQRII